MQTVNTVKELKHWVGRWRRDDMRVGLVPTMGGLHEAHLRLVDAAFHSADRVVATVFVNPMQFGEGEDFNAYPRDLDQDAALLEERGVHLLFAPPVSEIYPSGAAASTRVTVPGISDILCGAFRPGHFTGVATVVAKLFNLVRPDMAVFGEKDYQQLAVIRRVTVDLNFPVEVVGLPTVREADGLAMSSRNRYLSAEERRRAPRLQQILQETAAQLGRPGADFRSLEASATRGLEAEGFRPDYVSIRRAGDLQPAAAGDRDLVVLAAAWLGRARLIDNLPWSA
ncbi:MAG: pantoate--beta-alanine ligase [Gammaproteobacteria bacterium]